MRSPGQVSGLVFRHGLALVLPGVALGLVGAALLMVVAAAACWIPARRAVRTDPQAVLRGD